MYSWKRRHGKTPGHRYDDLLWWSFNDNDDEHYAVFSLICTILMHAPYFPHACRDLVL